jgi:hypothetical protein
MFIPDPYLDFLPIPDPGSRAEVGTGSRIRIRDTGDWSILLHVGWGARERPREEGKGGGAGEGELANPSSPNHIRLGSECLLGAMVERWALGLIICGLVPSFRKLKKI